MNNKNKVRHLVEAAMIGALYIALTYTQELLIPGTTSMAIQFRLSEILCLLCVFTPSAVWGLTIGTLLSNLVNTGALPIDTIIGTLATFLAAATAYRLRNIRFFTLPVLSSLMPVVFNAILIGLELEIFLIEGPFHLGSFMTQAGLVAVGEFVICVALGLPFSKLIERTKLFTTKVNKT